MKVLAVDDSHYVIEILELLLSDSQVEVLSALDAHTALNLMKKHKFDLLISDINMPGLSGIDLCFEVRKSDPLIPIILFTGQINKMRDYKSSLDKIGNVHYIENKDISELTDILSSYLPKK